MLLKIETCLPHLKNVSRIMAGPGDASMFRDLTVQAFALAEYNREMTSCSLPVFHSSLEVTGYLSVIKKLQYQVLTMVYNDGAYLSPGLKTVLSYLL